MIMFITTHKYTYTFTFRLKFLCNKELI